MIFPKSFFTIVVLGLAIGFAVFGNSLDGNFVYDDNIVLSNSLLRQPASLLKFFTEPYFENFPEGGLYRPLTLASFAFNFLISGGNPAGFHLFNVLLHIANSILVYFLLFKFTKSSRISLLSFIAFLVLPVHVEAVVSVVGRAELLSFFLAALSVLFWAKEKFFAAAILFFAALLSKETALALPLILLCVSRYSKKDKKWLYYFIIAVLGYALLRLRVLGGFALTPQAEFVFNPLKFVSVSERLATAFKILTLYIGNIFWPFNLSPDYSFNQIKSVNAFWRSAPALFGLAIFIFSISALAFGIWKKKINNLVAAVALFIFPYLIISNLFLPTGTIMADRIMYWPSLGLIFAAVLLCDFLLKHRQRAGKMFLFFGIFWMAALSAVTIRQNKIWNNETALFKAMFEKSPDSVVAKTNWARVLAGNNAENAAKSLLTGALNIYPDFAPALNLSAQIYKKEGNSAEAERFFEKSLVLRPLNEEALVGLSRVYFIEKKYRQAEHILNLLIPKYGGEGNIFLKTVIQLKAGRYQEAKNTLYEHFGSEPAADDSAKMLWQYADWRLGVFGGDSKELKRAFADFERLFSGKQ